MIQRFKLIVCRVLQKEAYFCAAKTENIIDIELTGQGLHEQPEKLCQGLQDLIAETDDPEGRPYDAILLGYGLCSNAIIGLAATIPLVVPRGHDCVTLLLGSKEKYKEYFDSHRGVYWYSPGWIQGGHMPGKQRYEKMLEEYRQKFGPEKAKYLMEADQSWIKEYSRATYIDWNLPGGEYYRQYTKDAAEFTGWEYDEIKGDPRLLQDLVDGNWNQNDFLTVAPGKKIADDLTNQGIIKQE